MGKYENIFANVAKARPLTTWEPSLPLGQHRLALVKYGGKASNKDKSIFLEAEFIVLKTNNEKVAPGTRFSWPWFINKPDEFGYTQSRAKNFLQVLQKCVNDESNVETFGDELSEDFDTAAPEAYGIMIDAAVTLVLDTKGNPRLGKKGNEVANVTWLPVSQNADDRAMTRATLTELARAPNKAAVATSASASAPATSPHDPSRRVGLQTLLKSRA